MQDGDVNVLFYLDVLKLINIVIARDDRKDEPL